MVVNVVGVNVMKNLYIIGNGFDLAHSLPTKYSNFKEYLISKYQIDEETERNVFITPAYQTNYKGLEVFDEKGFARLFINLIDDVSNDIVNWSDFEDCLGKIDWEKILDYEYNENYIIDGNIDIFSNEYNYEWNRRVDFYSSIASTIGEGDHILTDYFADWIGFIQENYIDSNLNLKKLTLFEQINDADSFFINFNYTLTLEKLYNFKNVFHIHGIAGKRNIVVGHGASNFDFTTEDYSKDDAMSIFSQIFERYKKNTKKIYQDNLKEFKKLSIIENIYIFGCSLSQVDGFYFEKISHHVSSKVNVKINIYDNSKEDYYLNILKKNFKNVAKWQ